MEYYYNYASAARKFVVGIAMIALVAGGYDRGVGVEAHNLCNTTKPSTGGTCPNYANCVNEVLAALLQETPKQKGFLFTKSYPDSLSAGSVIGSASCSQEKDQQHCKDCLDGANIFFDHVCGFAVSALVSNDDCTIWYGQN